MKLIPSLMKRHYLAIVSVFLITATLLIGMVGCNGGGGDYNPPPSENLEIRTWYDLDDVRDNLAGNHTLMNNLDSTTPGYEEMASSTANQGKGWEPMGTTEDEEGGGTIGEWDNRLTGTLDGQGYEIRDLFINRPDDFEVGLFGAVGKEGVVGNIGAVNVTVTGGNCVGTLVGFNEGTVSNSYSSGSVASDDYDVGGLVGYNYGDVRNSYSSANVTGEYSVGGLVGRNVYGFWGVEGTVSNSYFMGSVAGDKYVGGLVGWNRNAGTVSNSYSSGNITGNSCVGGLVGWNDEATVSDSYSSGSVSGNIEGAVGGLVGANGDAGTVSNSYSTASVTSDNNVGGLVGENAGIVTRCYSSGDVTGNSVVGGLVGQSWGTVSTCYSTGSVTGSSSVGGLVGVNGYGGSVSNSYSTGSVTGTECVGGLVGENHHGTVSSSFWDIQTSGQAQSDGGTGKNTTEMEDIATFSGAAWNIIEVSDPGARNPAYIWNIVNGLTYPFLSWQS
jgi:hypothetical protein